MKQLYTLWILLILGTTAAQAQIIGDTAVCANDLETYYAPTVVGASYSWSITGGTVQGSATLDSVNILWGAPGVGTIIVTINNPSGPPTYYTLNVTIHAKPAPAITHAPYPTCPVDTGRNGSAGQGSHTNCEKVCKYATIVYTTTLHAGSTYNWVATGASSVLGAATNTVTVTWDATPLGSLTVYETNIYGCMDSATICIEKQDLPVASFTNQSTVCKFSNTLFTNTSTNATSYFWDFGDGGTSTQTNPTHSYSTAGTYTITLIAENDCHCKDTFQNVITVDSLPGPTITCPSTVCANDTEIYSTTNTTGCTYNWFAIGGTIVAGQGTPTVTVAWGAGQLGTLGLYITGCGAVCSDTTLVYVPIVPAVATISGPTKVCAGDCEYYYLPRFSGATYHWHLGTGCGVLTDSTCCEKVQICWGNTLFACNDTLTVTYYDSILHCGGTASLIIHLRPKLEIYGNAVACANGTSSFNASAGLSCNWQITPTGPTISPANPTAGITVNWGGATGNFTISAVANNPNQTCNDTAYFVAKVLAPPAKPVITGDTLICPNSTQSYCATGGNAINWIITGGTPATAVGSCVTVNWGGTGPYMVQAFQQMANSPYCNSDTALQNVYAVSAGSPILTGPTAACANATNGYATTTVYPSGTVYTWSIAPPNAGAVLAQGASSTNIEWGNNAPQNVTVTLSVDVCGNTLQNSVTVTLNPIPTPTVSQIGSLCAGGSAQLQTTGGTSYVWSGPIGYTSAVNPTTILVDGLYQVTATDANGCTASSQYTVSYVSGPTASISTADYLGYCLGTSYSVNICALGNPNYTYVWSNAATSQCVTATSPGSYTVTVTDASNGCTAVSNVLTVHEDTCSGGGTCTPNGSISFTHGTCNPMAFTNTSAGGSNYTWNFGDLTTSNLTSPTHTYAQAGFYLVVLTGDVPSASGSGFCTLQDTAHIEIPLAAKFDVVVGCDGDPVCFTDMSTYTAGNNITSWSWSFGDATTSTLQNPCHTYVTSGTYNVTLTISNGTCTASITNSITIQAGPTAAFTFSSPNCINSAVAFTDGSAASINYWNWAFGDAGTSLNQNPSHSYSSASIYPVTLIVHDIYGCYDTVTNSVPISSPTLSGSITASPDTVVCAGTGVVLTAPPCGTCSYLWSNGATGNSITVTTTGIYSVTMTDGNGCPYSTFIRIIVNNGPPAAITNSGSDDLCLGDYTYLSVISNTNWLYSWITNDVPNNGATANIVYVNPATAGVYTYQVVVTDTTTGCSDTSLPYVITVHTPPVPPTITSVGPSTVCHGDTVILVATHPDPTVTFLWNTGDVGDTLYVTENGCYKLQVTDTNGCTNSASYCVTVNPLPQLCPYYEGCLDTCRPYIIQGPPGNSSYQWLLNGNIISGATSPTYTANVGGIYSVIVTNSYGCTDTTGDLNLSLHDCDTLCGSLQIDSVHCDSTGNYVMYYHVKNTSDMPVTQVNLEILQPNLNIPYAPYTNFTNIPVGGTSNGLSAIIYNAQPDSTLCFRVHIGMTDSLGHDSLCCYTDTACVTLPPCNPDTGCCVFRFISDSIWCKQTSVGTKYNFAIQVNGCGQMVIHSPNAGVLNVNNPYALTTGINTLLGSYIATGPTDTVLCLTFVMSNGGTVCKDTTICFPISCKEHPLPCNWDYNRQVCAGGTTFFGYYGSTVGLTITWSFPGGVPNTATGAGPHNIQYPTAGVYPFSMTLTNSVGSTTCSDSITVVAAPNATINQSGNNLYAYPSGMYYQWYSGTPITLIAGATNQFYSPPQTGFYCVVVTNEAGCSDTACLDYKFNGIAELKGGSWNIFPNPNDGAFTLALNMQANETVEMKIINALGAEIDHRVLEAKVGEQQFYIANEHFAPGIYFVQLITNSGNSTARMIVK